MGLLVKDAHSHFEEVYVRRPVNVSQYYYVGGQRIALRQDGVVYYLVGDHLGTTSLVLDAEGNEVAQSRQLPYGEERWSSGTLPTDYRFTGQRWQAPLGLYHMGARWYDSYINHFLSPDSIIPQPGNPQSLNRFSYAFGNPLRYRDPTGHWEEEWDEQFEQEHGRAPSEQDWWDYQFSLQIENWISTLWEQTYGLRSLLWCAEVTIVAGDVKWSLTQVANVGVAVRRIGEGFGGDVRRFIGGVTVKMNSQVLPWWERIGNIFRKKDLDPDGYEFWGTVYLEPDSLLSTIIHEMGHYFDERKDHRLREYKRRLRQAGLPTRNASEDFAVAFANYVLCVPMNAAKERYLSQFRTDEIPNAGGHVWPVEE